MATKIKSGVIGTLDSNLVFADNSKAVFGAGSDLQIYHNGSNSFIADVGTGVLDIQTNGTEIQMTKAGAELMAKFVPDGAVTLYYDHSPKLATTTTGIDVTGTATMDGLNVQNGSNAGITFDLTTNYSPVIKGSQTVSDLYLAGVGGGGVNILTTDISRLLVQNNGDISFYEDTGSTAKFFWDASAERLGISQWATPPTPAAMLHLSDNSNDIDVPQIRIEGRENVGDTKLDISVKDAGVRLNLIEGPAGDASNGYGLMEFKTNAAVNVGYPTRGGFKFTTEAHANNLVITNTGDIGINIATPRSKLSINSNGAPTTSTGNMATTGITVHNGTGGTAVQLGTYDAGSWSYIQSGYVNNATVAREFRIMNGANYTMTLSNTGNVGIGTTSPNVKLEVVTASTNQSRFAYNSTNYVEVNYDGFNVVGGSMVFETAGSEKMRVDTSGTLLVSATTASGLSNGTTNYGHSFGGGQQVNATNNDTNLILNMSNGSSNAHVLFRSDGGNTGSISTNGSSVSFNTGSDYRLKENVLPLKDGLDRVNKLKPVQFDWKKSQETDEGFIAHEVQEIVPYVVKGEKDGEEIQTMDYGKLTPLLVKAIQEQQTLIESLTARITDLEG